MSEDDKAPKPPKRLFRFSMDVMSEPGKVHVDFGGDGEIPEAITAAAISVLKSAGEAAGRLAAEVKEHLHRPEGEVPKGDDAAPAPEAEDDHQPLDGHPHGEGEA